MVAIDECVPLRALSSCASEHLRGMKSGEVDPGLLVGLATDDLQNDGDVS